MGVWQDIKARLGFGDDEYDEYDEYDEEEAGAEYGRPRLPYDEEPQTIRRVTREPDLERARGMARSANVMPGPGVQPLPQVKMQIVEPKTFAESQVIADKFKTGVPVIMNMVSTNPDVARRVLDFASGLTYGLNGGVQKVSDKVFMLTPANVDVADAQRAVMRDRKLFGIDDR